MNPDIEEIIKYDSEGVKIDYKREEYSLGRNIKKFEILKDISAFANHHSDDDKFIIIGVKEENGIAKEFFDIELTDEAKYQQFILENIEPKINFEYKAYEFQGVNLAYFRIFNNSSRPYLFKKDLQNPVNNKTEYRKGDGYIKIGSSSKKIDRSDLEHIYKTRYISKDRKQDIEIKAYYGKPGENSELYTFDINYIDIEIINNSNKSIDFDVEMKVNKNDLFQLIPEGQLVKEIKEQDRKRNSHFGVNLDFHTPIFNLDISFQEEDDFVSIERYTRSNKTAISLPQNSKEIDVFQGHLFVLQKEINKIEATVIIRSDDFTNGALIKQIIFKK
ncbi:helix-turn-helix domain-containing protein [Salegentibacter sp. Hel_I_6]|uniref:AlbA family DNA-binding domain-containing protein n=1 Tax=Salegentibacter sp. Hel_I_6 TaxID=1250278 RepID=UPI00068EF06B|nr:ATP-binding protein [Salegentibacter sp. Hel_I_6]